MPDEHRSILIFAVRNHEVATLSYSTASTEDVQSLVKVGLGLTFGESKPIPEPDEYMVVDWDTLEIIPETTKILKISKPGIVMLLPDMPLLELQDIALSVKKWILNGEMRREVEKQLELLTIVEKIRQGKIKFD